MAIINRNPRPDQTVIHGDYGSQYISWAFTQRSKDSGPLASMGRLGAPATTPSWSPSSPAADQAAGSAAVTTRLELANAVFEYLEICHNRQRRHGALGWRIPHRGREAGRKACDERPSGSSVIVCHRALNELDQCANIIMQFF
jgi:putative transposase